MKQEREFRNNIENTTNIAPLGELGPRVTQDTSNAIVEQERRGQAQLILSDVLPTKGLQDPIFKTWGIVIGEPVAGDEIFTKVALPKGWMKVPTDHDMWNNLVDDKGHVRASFFYKAAFYDRSAHIGPSARYTCARDYSNEVYKKQLIRSAVKDGDKVLYKTEAVPDPTKAPGTEKLQGKEFRAINDALRAIELAQHAECLAWLTENFPNHADPVESWNY